MLSPRFPLCEDCVLTMSLAQQGQIVLVEGPEKPIRKMYFRAPHRDGEATHIFPRGERGGVILGGCRQKGRWDGEPEMDFAEVMKQRCCALVPELGRPEDLKVIKHGVGLRRTYRTQDQSSRNLVVDVYILSWPGRWLSSRGRNDRGQSGDSQLWGRRHRISGRMVSHSRGAFVQYVGTANMNMSQGVGSVRCCPTAASLDPPIRSIVSAPSSSQ